MNDRFAFFQHWRDHPEDETTPLVLADWLEERSDPRAAFIRAAREWQLADRAVGENPESRERWAACLAAMNHTKQTMLKLLGTQLRPIAGLRATARMCCGHIEKLNIQFDNLSSNVRWLCEEPIHELELQFEQRSKLTPALRSVQFPLVHRITLSAQLFRQSRRQNFRPCEGLEEWCVSDRFPKLSEIVLHFGRWNLWNVLGWCSGLIPTQAWDAITIRVVPPDVMPVQGIAIAPAIHQFLESPIGSRLSHKDRERLRHLVGGRGSYDSAPVTWADFYWYQSDYGKGRYFGQFSKWTQHAMRQTSVDANPSSASGEGI